MASWARSRVERGGRAVLLLSAGEDARTAQARNLELKGRRLSTIRDRRAGAGQGSWGSL